MTKRRKCAHYKLTILPCVVLGSSITLKGFEDAVEVAAKYFSSVKMLKWVLNQVPDLKTKQTTLQLQSFNMKYWFQQRSPDLNLLHIHYWHLVNNSESKNTLLSTHVNPKINATKSIPLYFCSSRFRGYFIKSNGFRGTNLAADRRFHVSTRVAAMECGGRRWKGRYCSNYRWWVVSKNTCLNSNSSSTTQVWHGALSGCKSVLALRLQIPGK